MGSSRADIVRQTKVESLENRHLLSAGEELAPSTANRVELLVTPPSQIYPDQLTRLTDDRFLFVAQDSTHGRELWQTDGTQVGTTLLIDIFPGVGNANVSIQGAFDGVAFFRANDGVHGQELWRTDGTPQGTIRLTDVQPGATDTAIHSVVAFDRRVAFYANDPSYGNRSTPWVTDGTPEGTHRLSSLMYSDWRALVGPAMFEFQGELYTTAKTGSFMFGLYRISASGEPTIIKSLASLTPYPSIGEFQVLNDRLLFVLQERELWSTDGTSEGTIRLSEDIGEIPGYGACYHGMTRVENRVFFVGSSTATGRELWSTDGTPQGTRLVLDINPGASPGLTQQLGNVSPFAAFDGGVLFSATAPVTGSELWYSDGTPTGTQLVRDLSLGTAGTSPQAFHTLGGRVFFSSERGIGVSDGSLAGSGLLYANVLDAHPVWDRNSVTAADGVVFFDGSYRLWKLSPTDASPPVLRSTSIRNLIPLVLRLQFTESVTLLSAADVAVENLDSGERLTDVTVRIPFPSALEVLLPNDRMLPDGNYRVTIPAGQLRDLYGNRSTSLIVHDFFVFAGDANGDRTIDVSDFAQLAFGFNRPTQRLALDFDGSGRVDIEDFAQFAPKFNRALPPAFGRSNLFAHKDVLRDALIERLMNQPLSDLLRHAD